MLGSVAILAVSLLGVWKLIASSTNGLRLLIGGKQGRAGGSMSKLPMPPTQTSDYDASVATDWVSSLFC